MKVDVRNISRNVKVKEKCVTIKGDFSDSFTKSYRSATKEELENYINDIKKKGNRLVLTKTYADVKSYKDTIKEYLKTVVDYTYSLNKNTAFWDKQYYTTVETINEKLENLTKEVLKAEKENLDISATIDNIQGLLVDMYR